MQLRLLYWAMCRNILNSSMILMRYKKFVAKIIAITLLLSACKENIYDCAFFDELHKVDQDLRNDRRCNVWLYIADSLRK